MKRTVAAALCVGTVLIAGVAQAQEPVVALSASANASAVRMAATDAPGVTVTLEQCLAAALQNSGRQKAADHGVEVAEARRGQALSSRYPSLSAKVMATRMDEDPNFIFPSSTIGVPASAIQTPPMVMTLPANAFGPGFPPVNVPLPIPGSTIPIPAQTFHIPEQNIRLMDKTLYTGGLSAMYALYTGGLAGARIQQARAGVEGARHESRQTAAELAFDVKRAYYGVVLARKLRGVASDTLERMKATLELTESLYKTGSGRVKKTDYLRHSAMVNTIATMVTELEAQERTALAALTMLIGWNQPGEPAVADQDFPADSVGAGLDKVLRDALDHNPRVNQVQAGLMAMKAGITAAQAGHLPKVGIFANLNLIGNSYNAGTVTPDNKTMWAVGFGVEIPIFQGFRVVKEVQEARASRKKLEQQFAALRDGVALEVRRTLIAIEKAQAQRVSAGHAYTSSSENRDLHIRAYQDELVETKDLIESQLVEAVLAGQFFKVQYELVESRAHLELILGATGTDRQ